MKFLIGIVFLFVALGALGQSSLGQKYKLKIDYPDSGFTNKIEAKNIKVSGIPEGKWIEYLDNDIEVEEGEMMKPLTNDTNAPYYVLTVYRQGYRYGIERGYYKNGKLYFVVHILIMQLTD